MAEKSFKLPTEIDGELLDDEIDPVEAAEYQQEVNLQKAIAEFKGESNATMHIYNMDNSTDGRKGEFIEFLNIGDYTHEDLMVKLRDEYYGGKFKLQIRQGGVIKMSEIVNVVKSEPPKDEPTQSQDLAALVEAAKGDNSQMFQLMMNQNNQNMAMMMKMVEAIGNRPEPPRETFGAKEMIAMLAGVKEIMGDNKSDNPMELFIKGMEMGRETSDGKDDNIVQTALKTLGAPLAQLASQATEMQPQPKMGAPAPAPQAAHPGPPSLRNTSHTPSFDEQEAQAEQQLNTAMNQPANTGQEENMQLAMLQKLQPYLQMLVNAAAQNADPEIYANMILDQIDENTVKQFMGDEYYEKLFQFFPNVAMYRGWFDECRGIVLHLLENPDGDTIKDDETTDVPSEQQSTVIPGSAPSDTTENQENTESPQS